MPKNSRLARNRFLTSVAYYTRKDFSRIRNDTRKSRERELATFDENQRAVGTMRDKKLRHDACDHGLSRKSLRRKPPTYVYFIRVELESKRYQY